MANSDVPENSGLARIGVTETDQQRNIQDLFSNPAKAATAMLFVVVPLACRLMILKLQGASIASLVAAIDTVSAALSNTTQHRIVVAALRAAIVDDIDWAELKRRANPLIPQLDNTAAGIVYMIGAASLSPLPQAVHLQAWLLQQGEKLFSIDRSIRRELFYPFFKAFWIHAVAVRAHEFRTGEAYTRGLIESVDASSGNAVRHLLESMSFCLGITLPEDAFGKS